MTYFSKGDRVRVKENHRWMPDREGIIKAVEDREGNRFIVKFPGLTHGIWHDEDGDPVLRLNEHDLEMVGSNGSYPWDRK